MMDYRELYQKWLEDPIFDEETKTELRSLTDESEIEDRFYKELEFGTGGLRGIMGAGTNRMNRYTVRKATFGLANAMIQDFGENGCAKGVVIAYDSRNHSGEYALEAAKVLTACGIRVSLFDTLMPTPVLSFAVPYLGCQAGIVLTASHNPKEYNGYKVYDEKGCQLVPGKAERVIRKVREIRDYSGIPVMEESQAREKGLLCSVGEEVLQAFLQQVLQQSCLKDQQAKEQLKIVYTPLHGTGNLPVRKILKMDGFSQVSVVRAQEMPDGEFSTVRSPNPEEQDALQMAIGQAQTEEADLVLGTDPDCDRVGVGVRYQGEYRLLTGNQIGALLVSFVLENRKEELTGKSTLVKTIVTNELGADIARSYGLQVVNTLTGFKFIGEQIGEFEETEEKEFVIGYEESFGYLAGTHARDKDAVVSSMLICEMAAFYKMQGKTLMDALAELYQKYGYYRDALKSYTLKGVEGSARIRKIMEDFRNGGNKVLPDVKEVLDYAEGMDKLPKADVLKFIFQDDSWLAVRPSGTEPKIKFYFSMKGKDEAEANDRLAQMLDLIEQKIE